MKPIVLFLVGCFHIFCNPSASRKYSPKNKSFFMFYWWHTLISFQIHMTFFCTTHVRHKECFCCSFLFNNSIQSLGIVKSTISVVPLLPQNNKVPGLSVAMPRNPSVWSLHALPVSTWIVDGTVFPAAQRLKIFFRYVSSMVNVCVCALKCTGHLSRE